MREQSYYDLPFIYSYDGSGLTDGLNYLNVGVPTTGDSDFILRRIMGMGSVANQLMLRDANGRQRMSAPVTMVGAAGQVQMDYVVAPEINFPVPGSQIGLDLYNVARTNNPYAVPGSVPNYLSKIYFQGCRRYYGMTAPQTTYKYYDKPYTISNQITVDWAGRLAPAYQVQAPTRRFAAAVDNYDFELQGITITELRSNGTKQTAQGAVSLTIYAPGEKALMDSPVLDAALNMNSDVAVSVFPAPTIFYPAGSVILFDVQSMLIDTEVPATVWVDFVGVWRFPC